jgi:hypothetical protein
MSIFRHVLILSVMILFSGFANFAAAADLETFETYENACLKGGGSSHRVSLRILLKRHPDKKKLMQKFKHMDADRFCKCAFRKFESTFGKEGYVKFRDFHQSFRPSGMTRAQADHTISQVYLTCFGEQIGRPGLAPKN